MYHQFADPSQTTINYSDLSLMGSSSSRYEGFDPVQGTNSHQQYCFINRMLTPGNFHDGFIGEVPVESMSAEAAAAAAMFYDPRMVFGSVVNHGSTGGGSLVFEEGYGGGQVIEKMVQLGNKRKKKGAEEVGGMKNEKQRRERLSKKYEVLKELIPNPTKPDRATIIADTISYIQELLRTVDELKLLKRRRKSGSNKAETTCSYDAAGDVDQSSCIVKPIHHDLKGSSLRSSWLQRKSKDTHVDVRIVEDEVFIRLSHHKKIHIDCLLVVARVLDDLELEIIHLSGGNILGDLHVFMFNTKIHEGSSVYAGAIAKKIIEAMDVNYPELSVSSF